MSEAAGDFDILYIDDDPGLSRLAARHLTRAGYRVTCCETGERGLELLAQRRFDLIALDHYMPGIGGLETLKRIAETDPHPPVIYVTGAEDSRLAVTALKAGADDYVVKADGQFFFELLAEAVRQSLERVAIARQKEAAAREVALANERLEALVAQQQVLLREVNHRVSNSLQMMSALVYMQASAADDPGIRQALLDTQSRIDAIGHVHRHLYTSPNVEKVELGQYLTGLAAGLEQSLAAAERNIEVRREITERYVPTDMAISVGVMISELITNAFKYAFDGRDSGTVSLRLEAPADGQIRLIVADDGGGFQVGGRPRGTGLGSKVVHSIAAGMNAELKVESGPAGTIATIDIPL